MSVCMPLMMQRSSTFLATSGKRSETQRPLWPCWLNFQGEASSVAAAARPLPIGLPASAFSLRLVVEAVDVRRPPFHAEEDHPLGPGRASAAALGASGPADRLAGQVERPAKAM